MRHLLRALAARHDPLSDAALLERYARGRDPAAFEVLVWRHGGMVLGVCRRHLRDAHAAEDAFQATFLILARKAAAVRGDTLPGFLHRVARRVAGRAAVKTCRRRETPLAVEPAAISGGDPELAAVLDAEIDRLPDRLRQVVVLCYLDGRSTEDAATRLGIPRGTVLSRLHAARATLRTRLTRRGVTPPAVGLAVVLTAEQVAGCVGGGANAAASLLANEVLAMSGRKLVLAVAVGLVLAGGAGTGVGVLTAQSDKPGGGPGQPQAIAPAPPPATAEAGRRTLEQLDRERADNLQAENHRRRALLEAAIKHLDEKIQARRDAVRRINGSQGRDAVTDSAATAAAAEAVATHRRNLTAGQKRVFQLRNKIEFAEQEKKAAGASAERVRQATAEDQTALALAERDVEYDTKQLHIATQDLSVLRQAGAAAQLEADDLGPLVEQRNLIARELVRHTIGLTPPPEDKLDTILAELRAIRAKLDARP